MPKRIATVSVVVVRDKKRHTVHAHTAHDFSNDEIEAINKVHPGALRKPVNETADEDPNAETDVVTTPGKEGDKTANKANGKKGGKKTAAAEADSQSKAATKDAKSEDGEGTGNDAGEGEDDDI